MFKRFLLWMLLFPFVAQSQHELKGTFHPVKDFDFVILYKITPERMGYVVNGKVDKKSGDISLMLNEKVEPGVYRLVYELPEEENHFTFVYNGKEDIHFNFSVEKGVSFPNGQNKILNEYRSEMAKVQSEIQKTLTSGNAKNLMPSLIQRQKDIFKKAETSADAFTKPFIAALKPYIPAKFENVNAYQIYRKSNYFDNFDFNSELLQSSSYPLEIIKQYYYDYVTLNDGSDYRAIITDIFRETNTDKKFQKKLLSDFWQFLYDQKRTNAANFLAKDYLIPLAQQNNDLELAANLQRIVNTSPGSQAPDFEIKNDQLDKKLYDLDSSDFYLLIFWSTECSHCMAQMPEIYEELKDIPENKLKVVAIALEIEDAAWKTTSKKFPKYINVLALDTWRDAIVQTYDIQATPTFFILDADKEIVARPRGMKNLMTVIEAIKKYNP